ncbi:MAG: hypothetical protein HQM04_16745 [Magnetococcales bacterium]|nr:hypothetical protein [Magnetococcales bacterium]MBF0116679.1 hypothetical protein [Magnetococcales bacterium]
MALLIKVDVWLATAVETTLATACRALSLFSLVSLADQALAESSIPVQLRSTREGDKIRKFIVYVLGLRVLACNNISRLLRSAITARSLT